MEFSPETIRGFIVCGIIVAIGVFFIYSGVLMAMARIKREALCREALCNEIQQLKDEKLAADEKGAFFDRFILPAYRRLDADKEDLCKAMKITKEAYDDSMKKFDDGLEDNLLTERIRDILLGHGYIYAHKIKSRFLSGGEDDCEVCNETVRKLVEEVQSECSHWYEPKGRKGRAVK
jgi:hypothetical protein